MNTYVALYRNRRHELQATTTHEAQLKAAAHFHARRSYDVTVILAAREDGTPVVHTPCD